MILKCESCSNIFELSDPAYGWESNLDVSSCPNCNSPVAKPSNHLRLLNALLTAQLVSVFALIGYSIFNLRDPNTIYIAVLAVSTFSLLVLGNRKGTAIPLKKLRGSIENGQINNQINQGQG